MNLKESKRVIFVEDRVSITGLIKTKMAGKVKVVLKDLKQELATILIHIDHNCEASYRFQALRPTHYTVSIEADNVSWLWKRNNLKTPTTRRSLQTFHPETFEQEEFQIEIISNRASSIVCRQESSLQTQAFEILANSLHKHVVNNPGPYVLQLSAQLPFCVSHAINDFLVRMNRLDLCCNKVTSTVFS